jgi:3-hydroxy-9,10-secoandrosta-1,3,5(10)-triene-9,17-dione monooxygenase reductase component
MTIDHGEFRRALGAFPTGVTVVTTLDEDGKLQGLTANAFTSVSLDPPLVLICVGYKSRSYPSLITSGCFAVHILSQDQEETARKFAIPGGVRDLTVRWSLSAHGLPVLDEGYVSLIECRLVAEHAGGDHAILVGKVEAIKNTGLATMPLVYHRGQLLASGL